MFRASATCVLRTGAVVLLFLSTPRLLTAQSLEVQPIRSYGVLDGDACQTFGQVRSVAASDGGWVYVLDSLERTIRLLHSDRCIMSVGRAGRGPGEFAEPVRLRIHGDTVYVLDAFNLRIERFHADSNPTRWLDSQPISLVPTDFCVLRGEIVVSGLFDGHYLHLLDATGRPVRSWLRAPRPDHQLYSEAVGPEYLVCDNVGESVIAVAGSGAEIWSTKPDGRLNWSVRIPGFRVPLVTPLSNGGVRTSRGEGPPPHMVAGIAAVGPNHAIVQIGSLRGIQDFVELESFLLDLRSGAIAPLRTAIGRIVGGTAHKLYAIDTEEFFPRLTEFRYRFPGQSPTPRRLSGSVTGRD